MKLFAASLLVASAISFTSASTCQSPIVSNGQCIGVIKKKFRNVDCSSRSATDLMVNAEGKLCFTGSNRDLCLTRRYRNGRTQTRFRMSSELKGSKMAFVKFNYDAVNNQLKVTAPNDQANKYPVFDEDVQITLSDSAEDVGCSNVVTAAPTTAAPTTAAPTTAVPTTAAPTTAAPTEGPIRTVSRTGDYVTITQTSNNELHITKTQSWHSSIFIEKDFDYFTMRIVNYVEYNSVGLSIKQDEVFRSWNPSIFSQIGKKPYTIGHFVTKNGNQNKIYRYLSSYGSDNVESLDRVHNDGETIKISKTDTVIEFSRDGVVYYTYTFQAADRKDLFPALCVFDAGDEYFINIH